MFGLLGGDKERARQELENLQSWINLQFKDEAPDEHKTYQDALLDIKLELTKRIKEL